MVKKGYMRKISAILSADVAGYSRLMENDETETVSTLEAYRKIIFSIIENHRGRVVDSPGDNILSEFTSVVDAVQCAVEIQEVIQVKNADLPENRWMRFRVGINLGDVIEEGGRIYGDGVNLAARIESMAEPGSICISGSAYDQIKRKLALGYQDLGKKKMKNITEPIRVYRIPINSGSLTDNLKHTVKKSKLKWLVSFIITGIFCGIISLLIWNNNSKPSLTRKAIKPYGAEQYKKYTNIPVEGIGLDKEFLKDLDKRIEQVQEHVSTQFRDAFDGLEGNKGKTSGLLEAAKEKPLVIPAEKPSIAVLPFSYMSEDPDQEHFADGMTEELITRLSKSSQLSVIARDSSFTYKGKPVKIQQVGRELGVQYLIEGSVRQVGNKMRITAQLIDTNTALYIWSETYNQEFDADKLFAIQDQIAEQIAEAVISSLKKKE